MARGPWTLVGPTPHDQAGTVDGKTMTMTPEAWTVIGTGVVILIAIAASNRQLRSELRTELRQLRSELRSELRTESQQLRTELNQVHAEIGQLRERMAKLEGLLEGLREAITGRKVA